MRAFWSTWRMRPFCSAFLNPRDSMVKSYWPGVRPGRLYCPIGFDTVCRRKEVSTFTTVIEAPAMAAPLESLTTPEMVAVPSWAARGGTQRTAARKDSRALEIRRGMAVELSREWSGVNGGQGVVPLSRSPNTPRAQRALIRGATVFRAAVTEDSVRVHNRAGYLSRVAHRGPVLWQQPRHHSHSLPSWKPCIDANPTQMAHW